MTPVKWNPSDPIPAEIREKPKKSLGYKAAFSTVRVRPVTGREWVYTATDDQMKVLYDIERLFAGMVSETYQYVFRERHGLDDDESFDGWSLLVRKSTRARAAAAVSPPSRPPPCSS